MNSSSSSSECYCDDCYCYGVNSNAKSQRGVWKHPFCCNTTQPLVFYAQVPPTCKQRRSREIRKESPNCFVKAFKWYTQELAPCHRNQCTSFNSNMTGFATWLDTKYQQFVRESQLDQTSYCVKLQETSSLEAYKTAKETKSKTKRKYRVKSPWRKRKDTNKEGGDMSQKSHHSFKYIMQPKEMTRNVSEWCQPTPTSLHNRSNVTIVSTELCNCKKLATKSLSLTSVHQDNKSNATFKYLTKETVDRKKNANDKSHVTKTKQTQEISCQCATEMASKITSETQYEDPIMINVKSEQIERTTKVPGQICEASCSNFEVILPSNEEMPKKGTVKKMVQEFDPRRHISCQCTEEITKIDVSCQCAADIAMANNNDLKGMNPPKVKPSISYSSKQVKSALTNTSNTFQLSIHSTAQTSDHPINLGNDLIHQYPFFMKIVCADKLCDDCILRYMNCLFKIMKCVQCSCIVK